MCVRAIGGKCILAVQASSDGLTWSSPIANVRLGSEPTTVKLRLPERTRKIRALIENTSHKSAYVEIEDPSEAVEADDAAL